MFDEVFIGPVPAGEPCSQVGDQDYHTESRMECRALIGQIRRERGEEPNGARLTIKAQPHDFGTYYEVVCRYSDGNETAAAYAWDCEDLPENWDKVAIQELKSQGYSFPVQNHANVRT